MIPRTSPTPARASLMHVESTSPNRAAYRYDNTSAFSKPPSHHFGLSRRSFSSFSARHAFLPFAARPSASPAHRRSSVSPSPWDSMWQMQRRSLFITTENTPNPDALKFIPDTEKVLESGSVYFENGTQAFNSPLAKGLFQVDGVKSVMLGAGFITITKSASESWSLIKPLVFQAIANFYATGRPVLTDTKAPADTTITDEDDEVVSAIKEVLETRVRPVVQEDGGDIEFRGFENGIVLLKLQGSCSTCPSSSATLKNGIENMLMHYIPEVQGVEQFKDAADNEAEKHFAEVEARIQQSSQ